MGRSTRGKVLDMPITRSHIKEGQKSDHSQGATMKLDSDECFRPVQEHLRTLESLNQSEGLILYPGQSSSSHPR